MESIPRLIVKATENSSQIINFLMQYEYECAQLCSIVKKDLKNIYVIYDNNSKIWGVLSLSKILHYCLPFLQEETQIDVKFKDDFFNLIEQIKVASISGEFRAGQIILAILKEYNFIPYQVNYYDLYILQNNPIVPNEPLCNGDYIRRCTIDDLDYLQDVQKQYLIQEVAPKGKEVADLEVKINLKQILQNQLVFGLFSDSEIVAKANSNAIGFNWVQLGGVFTHPLYRRNEYAWHLVSILCQRIINSGKNVCLFVKDKNIPAINLYKKTGFLQKGKYIISYFKY